MDSERSGDPVEGHTLRVVDQALADLRLRTLSLGSLVIDQLGAAVDALLGVEVALADKVLARESQVNAWTREIDHRAFECIALRQLVAGDLRLARAISRIVVDLERAGDECKNLARIGVRLQSVTKPQPLGSVAAQLRRMADMAGAMLRNALRSLDEASIELAEAVAVQDRELDQEFSAVLRAVLTGEAPGRPEVGAIVDTVFAAKSLERIGDHAKNVAEQAVYFVIGDPPNQTVESQLL